MAQKIYTVTESLKKEIRTQAEQAFVERLSRTKFRQAAEAVADETLKIIMQRTAQGVDVDGRRFPRYSKGYEKLKGGFVKAAKKVSRGKSRRNLATKLPNWMRLTGQMLSSMTTKNARLQRRGGQLLIEFDLTFTNAESGEIASYHNDTGAGKSRIKRRFLGLSRKGSAQYNQEQVRIQDALFKALKS
jgi:hypothetical protein